MSTRPFSPASRPSPCHFERAERVEKSFGNSFSKILSIFVIQREIKIMERIRYIHPECDIESDFRLLGLLCQSPEDGGLEEISYEDWVG